MAVFSQLEFHEHEQVVFCHDKASGLKAIIAIHNTLRGPAVGGCRLWNYANDEEALVDVLRLSRGMTYKNALANLPFGGGKAVIIGPKEVKSEALFRSLGRFIHSLSGRYITAEDVGITTDDISIINKETPYATGRPDSSGDPGVYTALGTYLGIKAAVKHQLNKDDLSGLTISVQGVGSVGYRLCKYLHDEGVKLVVTDINTDDVNRVVNDFAAKAVALDDIYREKVDVYAPCALGATINDKTIEQLQTSIIAGCANNQLAELRHGQILHEQGILYAPDYVINAGGIINVSFEDDDKGYNADKSETKVRKIYQTLSEVFRRSKLLNKPTQEVADLMANEILAQQDNSL